jgi:hypothetical protein
MQPDTKISTPAAASAARRAWIVVGEAAKTIGRATLAQIAPLAWAVGAWRRTRERRLREERQNQLSVEREIARGQTWEASIEKARDHGLRERWSKALMDEASICELFLREHGRRWARERTNMGDTPLGFAAKHRRLPLWRMLIENGASPKDKDAYGWNALMAAAIAGQIEMAEDAARRGVDLDEKGPGGATALMLMAGGSMKPSESVARWLVERSDACAEDNAGRNALHHVAGREDPSLAPVQGTARALAQKINPLLALDALGESPADHAKRACLWGLLDEMLGSPLLTDEERLAWAKNNGVERPLRSLAAAEAGVLAQAAGAAGTATPPRQENATEPAQGSGDQESGPSRKGRRL